MDTELFVQNVKMYCAIKGVKPTNACAESGAGKSLISDVTSRGRIPSVERLQLLAKYLGCTVSDLLGEQPKANNSSLPKESELLRKITALSPEYREKAEEYLDFLTGLQDKQ